MSKDSLYRTPGHFRHACKLGTGEPDNRSGRTSQYGSRICERDLVVVENCHATGDADQSIGGVLHALAARGARDLARFERFVAADEVLALNEQTTVDGPHLEQSFRTRF